MMKKLFAWALLACASLSAMAQSYRMGRSAWDSPWDFGGHFGIMYNYVGGVPEHLSHSGLGLDFCLFEGQYHINSNSMVSLGILDVLVDFRFPQKGYIFSSRPTGAVVKAEEDSRAKANFSDVVFSFPLGFTQRFNACWAASLYVAPGLGLVRYNNNYIAEEVHHRDSFYPVYNRTGFRLDVKAVLWFEDLGIILRYQPVGFTLPDSNKKNQTFSVGLSFCY